MPPQATIDLKKACQAFALLNGRNTINHDDIIHISHFVLSHRIVRNYKAEAEGIDEAAIVNQLLQYI